MTEALSVSEAAELFSEPAVDEGLPVAPEGEAGPEQDLGENPTPDAPETASEEGEAEEGEEGEPETPAIDPPAVWSEKGKELFKSASPELQAYLTEQHAQTQAEITKRQMEAADLRKQVTAVYDVARSVENILTEKSDIFDAKWQGVTEEHWDELALLNPEEFQRLKGEYKAERGALEAYRAQRDQAVSMARDEWAREQADIIRANVPELTNPENINALVKFAEGRGLGVEVLNDLNATAMSLLWDAYRYNNQPKAAPVAEKAPEKPALKPSIKGSALGKPQPNQFSKFDAAPTIANAAALF